MQLPNTIHITGTIHCPTCDFVGPVLRGHRPPPWWSYLLAMTGLGIVALILATYGTRRTCPRCGEFRDLRSTEEAPYPDAIELWQKAEAADRRELSRRQLLLLTVLPAAFIALVLALIWLIRQA